MSTTETKLPLARARQIADCLVADMRPHCLRCEVAGSIRRGKAEVGNIELVAVPKRCQDLLGGEGQSLLDPLLEGLEEKGLLVRLKGGPKFKQYLLPRDGVKLDLFLATEENFGLIFMIRTGSADFSRRLVTQRKHGGLLPSHLRVKDGQIWSGDKVLPTPDEAAVFAILGIKPVPAKERV